MLYTTQSSEYREEPLQPIKSPASWTSKEYKDRAETYTYTLTTSDIAELADAVHTISHLSDTALHALQHAPTPPSLPTLSPTLSSILSEVQFGKGFALIRGIPVQTWSRREVVLAYYIVGLHWGTLRCQNARGHLVGHVRDLGLNPNNFANRVYATRAAQPWHVDTTDIVGLLCLQPAAQGGISSWASSVSIYNTMLQQRPDLVNALMQPLYVDRKGEVPPHKHPYYMIPVFSFHAHRLSVYYQGGYYEYTQRHAEVPRLTQLQQEGIDMFAQLAQDDVHRLDHVLQPGDIQLLHNHTMVHTRTAFIDDEDEARKRHLLRLWVAPANARPLPPVMADAYGGSVVVGARGGVVVPYCTPHLAFDPWSEGDCVAQGKGTTQEEAGMT